jgi:hypothetical protein
MPLIVDDVAEIIAAATIFSLSVVLSYSPMCVVVSKMHVTAVCCCCFTSGSFCLIIGSVTTGRLTLMASGYWGHYDDVAYCLNPLLG